MTDIKICKKCESEMSVWSVFAVMDEIVVRLCCDKCGICEDGTFKISDIKKWETSPAYILSFNLK